MLSRDYVVKTDFSDVVRQLQLAGLTPHALALSFGDVLGAAVSRRVSSRACVKDLLILVALVLPRINLTRKFSLLAHAGDSLLISAGHDDRSVWRIEVLAEALLRCGVASTHLGKSHSTPRFPGWSIRDAFLELHCSVRSLLLAMKCVRKVKRTADLRLCDVLMLLRWICVQEARRCVAHDALLEMRPGVVVTDYDRGLPGGPFAVAANELSIPTVTLLHGDPHRLSYAPPIAKYVCFWNEIQAQTLSKWSGYEIGGEVVGSYWGMNSRCGKPLDPRNCLLVQTGSESIEEYLSRQAKLVQALDRSGRTVRVRPHPRAISGTFRALSHVEISSSDLRDDLSWASIVFCDGSSVALDALASGRSVAVPLSEESCVVRLASLESTRVMRHSQLPIGWGLLAAPSVEGWPYKYVGDVALERTALLVASVRIEADARLG